MQVIVYKSDLGATVIYFFSGVHFHKIALCAQLDSGSILLAHVMVQGPVENVSTHVQQPEWVPDQVGRTVVAMIVGRPRSQPGVLHGGIRINYVRTK